MLVSLQVEGIFKCLDLRCWFLLCLARRCLSSFRHPSSLGGIESENWWNSLYLQMDLNHAVDLLSRLGHLELYQEYGFTHLNIVTSSHTYLAFGLASICHLDPRLRFCLRLYGCKTEVVDGSSRKT